MPKLPAATLTWSPERNAYTLHTSDQLPMWIESGAEGAWLVWLTRSPSFSFQGRYGHLNVFKELRARGAGYWYAYQTRSGQTRKRYLGRSTAVTLARLEEVAQSLEKQAASDASSPPAQPVRYTSFHNQERGQQPPLLLPKLRPPRLPSLCISRQRLLARMEKGSQGKLTLLVAPAGFGKTTLVRQWIDMQSQDTQLAWISLDPEDDDPIRFWDYVLTACQVFEGEPSHHALRNLSTDEPFFTSLFLKKILTAFLNDLVRKSVRGVLVLEDYHVITSSQIHESLAFLLDHLPVPLHLVILTRSEPPLPLARWRAKSDLEEIDATDLRFSTEEIISFLEQTLPSLLPPEMLQSLEAHLEGWPTGFYLLALALQKKRKAHEVEQVLANFSGSHRYLLDYFLLEVLAAQPETLQIFLFQTSMLNRMTASLCDAITGRDDSEHLLKEVERAGLFLQSLPGEELWYRYHRLFAEAMQVQARHHLSEEDLRLCLSRASAWYEQREMFLEGIEVALQAEEWMRAIAMMERLLDVQGRRTMREHSTILRWLETLPDQLFEIYPTLCVNSAAALLFTLDRRSPETIVLIEKLLTRAEHSYERQGEWGKLGEALSCHAEVARWHADIPRTISLAERALDLPPEPGTLWRGNSVMIVGIGALYAGRPEEARRMILEAQAILETPLPGSGMPGTSFILSEICLQQGQLHQAEQLYRHLLATANGNFATQGQALLGMAKLSYERNSLSEAEQYVAQMLELGNDHLDAFGRYFVETGFFFPGKLLLARLQQANGNLSQAQKSLEELLVLAQERQWLPLYREVLLLQAELNLEVGDLAAVERWQAICHNPGEDFIVIEQEHKALIVSRWLIAQGAISEALSILEYWQREAHAWRRIRSEIEIHILLALAHAASQNTFLAKMALKEALTLAQVEGFRRLFLEKGEALATLLRVLFLDLREKSLVSFAKGLLLAFARSSHQATLTLLVEPLTEAEQRVLGLLSTGRTNKEIARELIVSINTVKTQVQSLYRKLNVKSRWEAREAARRLDLF